MKAAVFSDTHSNTLLMAETVRRCRPDVIIHLGDHDKDTHMLRTEFPHIPLYSVCGNCDLFPSSPETDTVPLGPVKAFIAHGHQYNVNSGNLSSLAYAAMEAGCGIAMFGHTHRAMHTNLGGVEIINPGTAGKGRELTWALVEVFDDGKILVSINEL